MKEDTEDDNSFDVELEKLRSLGCSMKPVIEVRPLRTTIECEGRISEFHASASDGYHSLRHVVNFEGGGSLEIMTGDHDRLVCFSAHYVDIEMTEHGLIIRRSEGPQEIDV